MPVAVAPSDEAKNDWNAEYHVEDPWVTDPDRDMRNCIGKFKTYVVAAGVDTAARHIGTEQLIEEVFGALVNVGIEIEYRRKRPHEDLVVGSGVSVELALFDAHSAQIADSITAAAFEADEAEPEQDPAKREKRKTIVKQQAENSSKKAKAIIKNEAVDKKAKAIKSTSSSTVSGAP